MSRKHLDVFFLISFFLLAAFVLSTCSQQEPTQTKVQNATPVLTFPSPTLRPATVSPTLTPTYDIDAMVTRGVATYSAKQTQDAIMEAKTPSRTPGPTNTPTPTSVLCPYSGSKPLPQVSGNTQVAYISNGQVWVWDVKTQKANSLALPAWAQNPYPSANGRRIAFKRIEGHQYQIWMMDLGTGKMEELVNLSDAEILKQNPDTKDIGFGFAWFGDHIIDFSLAPSVVGIGWPPYYSISYVNVDAKWSHTLTLSDHINDYRYAPDGNQVAILTAQALLLIDAPSGSIRYSIPLSLVDWNFQDMKYSPDGHYLVVFTADGIAIVNPADGTHKMIDLKYYNSAPPLPRVYWQPESQSFYTALTNPNDTTHEMNLEVSGQATFTVWKIGLEKAEATEINTFTGIYFTVLFSPDFNLVSFSIQNENRYSLNIAQLSTGNSLVVDANAGFDRWNPDSVHFLYSKEDYSTALFSLFLGGVCEPSKPFSFGSFENYSTEWIDSSRAVIMLYADTTFKSWSLYLFDVNTGEKFLIDKSESVEPVIEWLIKDG
jgi:Tol biopolymer transport system component